MCKLIFMKSFVVFVKNTGYWRALFLEMLWAANQVSSEIFFPYFGMCRGKLFTPRLDGNVIFLN